jgi:hypothetical protein
MNQDTEIKMVKDICIDWIYNWPNNIKFIKLNNNILSKEDIKELEELAEFLKIWQLIKKSLNQKLLN